MTRYLEPFKRKVLDLIAVMAAESLSVQRACRLLGVSESGYYAWKTRVPSNRQIRHAWLLEQIQAVHEAA